MRRKISIIVSPLVYFFGISALWGYQTLPQSGRVEIRIPFPSDSVKTTAYSPKADHVAFLLTRGDTMYVILDSMRLKEYSTAEIFELTFSEDGKHLAYAVNQTNFPGQMDSIRGCIVLDGNEIWRDYWIHNSPIVFSPDGNHLAFCVDYPGVVEDPANSSEYYTAYSENLIRAIVDNARGGLYNDIGALEFSQNGDRVVYFATKATYNADEYGIDEDLTVRRSYVVIDGLASEIWPGGYICFSPSGKRLAYLERAAGDKYRYIIDGKKQNKYANVGPVRFSADDRNEAYWAAKGDKCFMVINEAEQKQYYDNIFSSGEIWNWVHFSPNSQHYATIAQKSGNWLMIVDGNEISSGTAKADFLVFSPNSESIAWDLTLNYDSHAIQVDSLRGRAYNQIIWGEFSPDSKHMAYFASDKNANYLIIDTTSYVVDDRPVQVDVRFETPDTVVFNYITQTDKEISLVRQAVAVKQ
jgi:hypothetical protein